MSFFVNERTLQIALPILIGTAMIFFGGYKLGRHTERDEKQAYVQAAELLIRCIDDRGASMPSRYEICGRMAYEGISRAPK